MFIWIISFASQQKLNMNRFPVLYQGWLKKERNIRPIKWLKRSLIVNKNIRRVNRERAVLDVYQS